MTAHLTVLSGLLLALSASAQPKAVIRVEVRGLRNDKGKVECRLFASADGYPNVAEKAAQKTTVAISGGKATCVFAPVAPGDYGVAAMHDENGDGKLEKSIFGKPIEGTAHSRDAPMAPMGPPKWDDAVFKVGETAEPLAITVHY